MNCFSMAILWNDYINKQNRINEWNFVHCLVSTFSKIEAVPIICLLKYTHNLNYN